MATTAKLYHFYIEVRDGEHEYSHLGVVRARTGKAAEKKARKKAEQFLGSRMKWTDERTLEPVDGSEYRIVRFEGVQETTIEEILSRVMW